MEIIVSAKDRQTAEAYKKAFLLEELDILQVVLVAFISFQSKDKVQ
jgi:hypothetical protein